MGNVVIPLVIVIVLGVAYIVPRRAIKSERIANSRIEDRFSSGIKVLDTSARHASPVAQCSRANIHPKKSLSKPKKNGITMNKASSIRIKNTNDVRVLAGLKAEYAANNSRRENSLRILMIAFTVNTLIAFVLLGGYFASIVSIYWVLGAFALSAVVAGTTRIKLAQDKREALIEKKKITALQHKISLAQSVSKAKTKASTVSQSKARTSKPVRKIQEQAYVPVAQSVEQTDINDLQDTHELDAKEIASKWTATRIPTPLYARAETRKVSVATHEDIQNAETSGINRTTKVAPVENSVSTDQLVENEVRFNLEDVLRSRTAG